MLRCHGLYSSQQGGMHFIVSNATICGSAELQKELVTLQQMSDTTSAQVYAMVFIIPAR
jgi:hypothetical protein